MATEHFFHVGILVEDIDQAIDRFSEMLGIEFAGPETVPLTDLEEPGRDGPFELTLAYSKQGPPHVELLEATGDGVYGAHHGYGLHHYGTWTDDFDGEWSKLTARGMKPEAVFSSQDGRFGGFLDPRPLLGVRYEILSSALKPDWEAWLRDERPLI